MSRETLKESLAAVERVVSQALIPSLEPAGSAVPPELVRAVAEGVGVPGVVLEVAERRLRNSAALELVLFDTDRIAEFVFESSRPPVIRGASKLLDDLNDGIGKDYGDFVLYSGGGEGLLLVPAGRGESICREIEARYAKETAGALGVTTGWLAARPADFLGVPEREAQQVGDLRLLAGTPALLARLRDAVRRTKDAKRSPRRDVPGSSSRCASCRDRAGIVSIAAYRKDERGWLCPACVRRWQVGRAEIDGLTLEELVASFAKSVDQGEAEGSAAQDLGFLYADGNAMGALFSRLGSLAELRFLSGAVRDLFRRLENRVLALLAQKTGRQPRVVSLLSGGDEAIWLLPAVTALEVATRLPGWLDDETKTAGADLAALLARGGRERLTVGMGLVICDYSYPVRAQHRLAKALQKSAKKRYYASPPKAADSVLDFEILPAGSPLTTDLATSRRLAYGTDDPDFFRTCRPYRAQELVRLRRKLEAAERHQIARGVWYGLQDSAREGKAIYLNFFGYQLARDGAAAEKLQKWLRELGADPFDRVAIERFLVDDAGSSWIGDLVELARYWEIEGRA